MSNKKIAESSISTLLAIIQNEVGASGEKGMRNDEVARALGLETSVNGGQRNHLTHALLNKLVENGALSRRKEGRHVYYVRAQAI